MSKKVINRLCILLLCALFFLPLATCSSFTGLDGDGMNGIKIGTSDDGNPLVFLLLIIPIVLLFISFKENVYAALRNMSIVGCIGIIIFMIMLNVQTDGMMKPTLFTYLKLVIYIGLVVYNQLSIK